MKQSELVPNAYFSSISMQDDFQKTCKKKKYLWYQELDTGYKFSATQQAEGNKLDIKMKRQFWLLGKNALLR